MNLHEWNSKLQDLRKIILMPDHFNEAMQICLELHAMVHVSETSGIRMKTFEDELWEGLDEQTARFALNAKGRTIAYGIWHSTRIEDLTMNLLVACQSQIFSRGNWQQRIHSSVTDTGNALSSDEIVNFSKVIDLDELRRYRIAVGVETIRIIESLQPGDMKRKVDPKGLQQILDERGVLDVPESNWLIDFWGRKNVAGILLMPVTRHHVIHLNESFQARKKGLRVYP